MTNVTMKQNSSLKQNMELLSTTTLIIFSCTNMKNSCENEIRTETKYIVSKLDIVVAITYFTTSAKRIEGQCWLNCIVLL